MEKNKFVFGPITSRRLGLSLGINVLGEKKKCTFNCVYCEIGRSKINEVVPISYRYTPPIDEDRFRNEIEPVLAHLSEIDSATFGYMGETTLASDLEEYLNIARAIKETIARPDMGPLLSIFTNSTTLGDPSIRSVLARFDLVMAKLDCAVQDLFKKVNRPDPSVPPVSEIIENIALLREEMQAYPANKLAIQTLLFKSMNPSIPSNLNEENLEALAKAYDYIRPNIVQIYSVARDPAEAGIYAISAKDKEDLKEYFSQHVNATEIDIRIY
ncbi:MAG TPA: hypothetical protein VKM55_05250 [Candidatus Lokiarchaeia archaeon]|nr:hypothetical protein [Candidatus Lokiarchaeia archaeon]